MEGEIVADSMELEDHLGEDLQSIFSTYPTRQNNLSEE